MRAARGVVVDKNRAAASAAGDRSEGYLNAAACARRETGGARIGRGEIAARIYIEDPHGDRPVVFERYFAAALPTHPGRDKADLRRLRLQDALGRRSARQPGRRIGRFVRGDTGVPAVGDIDVLGPVDRYPVRRAERFRRGLRDTYTVGRHHIAVLTPD